MERAKQEIEKIRKNYKIMGINLLQGRGQSRISKDEVFYTFENRDTWRAVIPKESCRGNACNIAYVDDILDDNLIKNIILPTVKCLPYKAVHYWR